MEKPIKVKVLNAYMLNIVIENGQVIDLDLTPLIENRTAFWRLKNFRYFKQVDIDPLGGLCWPEGEDISPSKLLTYAIHKPMEQ